MADVNAEIGVSIDTSGALAQLKSLQREIARFHASVAKSSEAAALAQRDLQRNFLNGVNAIQGFSAELRTVKTTAENFTDSLERNKFSMREYFRYSMASTKTFGRAFTAEMDTVNKVAVENVKRLQTQYIKMGRDANGAMKAIAVMPTQLDMSNLTTQTQLAAQRQAVFNQLVKQGSTNLLNFGKNTQWAGRQLMVGFTLPLAGLGAVASKTFMDMETAAIKFKKVYGDLFTAPEETQFALESVQMLGQEFAKYGIAVADTVALAAEAAAAGFAGADLQAQVAQATRLQVLGQVEQQKALETTISLQNAFRISSNELADAINFLNAVENQTVVSLDDITTAIPKAAPIIQELGGDVKDLAFFMAAMKEGGINASEGANALKSGLASLINPTGKAKEMLNEMGIDIDRIVESNVGNVKATVIEFAKALDGLSSLERQRAIEQLFGKFQQARLSALFDNVIRDGNQASRVLDLASASVEDLASLAERELGLTADSAMNKFRASVELLKASLAPVGEVFLQILTPILDKLNNLLEWFNGLSDTSKQVIAKVIFYLGGLAPILLMTIGLMANFVANGIKGLMLLRNGFLRLSGQSQILGEQTQYLTVEQQNAVAAAASLEQSHIKLQQAFTGEAGAVRQLINEYQRMIAAQNAAATRFPGMMQPGFKPRGYAKGVVSVPGPRGAGDVVPAMVSPGEAIIPAKMAQKYGGLINGMINDNIPGFKKGRGIERAHATMPFLPESEQFRSIFTLMPELKRLNDQFPGMIRVVSNLTAELPTSLNQAMKERALTSGKVVGGTSIKNFSTQYGSLQDKFAASALRGGADINNPSILAATRRLEVAIGERAVAIAQGTQNQKVTDTILAKATQDVIEEFKLMDAESRQVAQALDRVGKQVGQIRVQPSQAQYRQGLQSGLFVIDQASNTAKFGNVEVARPKSSLTKSGLPQARPASNIPMPGNYQTGQDLSSFVSNQAAQVVDNAILATAAAAGTRSPSRRTIPIGEDIARGLQVGMANQIDETKAMAGKLSSAASGLINPNTGKPFTQQEIANLRKVSATEIKGMVGAAGQTAFLGMPSFPDVEEQKEQPQRRRGVRGAISRGVARVSNAGGGFGLSGALLGLSMLPGKLGQLAQSIMPVVFGLQALSVATKLIGGLPVALLAVGAGLFMFKRKLDKTAEELDALAKREAEARNGSVRAIEEYSEFTQRALPSAREFSRNNRQLISASGEAVKRFKEFYDQNNNTSRQIITEAAQRNAGAGVRAAAVDIAQRAAIFGLGPADIAANIKAAADLVNADQVQLRAKVQEILAPNGDDITKTPLTLEARIKFLREDSARKLEELRSSVNKIATSGASPIQTLQGEKNQFRQARFGASIEKLLRIEGPASKKYEEMQKKIQNASVQLSFGFTQETEALALLNAQYDDGLISKKEYDAQFAVSKENLDLLGESQKKLIEQLELIDPKLATKAMKDFGDQAMAAIKKANPRMYKELQKALEGIENKELMTDIFIGFAKGSLTQADLVLLPGILDKIDGKSARVALEIIASSSGSDNLKDLLSEEQLKARLAEIKAFRKQYGDSIPLLREEATIRQQLADIKKRDAEAGKITPKGQPSPDKPFESRGAKGAGKFLDLFEKELEALRKKRDALKDINDEMDRQNQYQMKQMDLINQASRAKISGNFLEAAQLQQQSMLEGANFTRESSILQLDRILNKGQDIQSRVKDTKKLLPKDKIFLERLKAGNFESIVPMPQTPGVGFGSRATGFAGSTTNVGGAVYTVTMNISGENANEIANKVMNQLKLLENKNNKSNKVR